MSYVKELRALVGTRPLILVGAVVIICDDKGGILLEQRRHPYGQWGLPGGLMEIGETGEETARRELLEEAGLVVGELELVGVYSGPDQFATAANGDQICSVTIAYYSRDISGEIRVNPEESLGFEYAAPTAHFDQMSTSYRVIIEDYLQQRAAGRLQ